jgi:ABC-type multidrug transport system fused ATPase/permease subunit
MVLAIGFLELIGIGLFVPILDNSDNLTNKILNDAFAFFEINKNVISLSIMLLFVFTLKLIIMVFLNKFIAFNMHNFVYYIRSNIVEQISNANFLSLQKYSKGDLNNIITKEAEKISEGYTYVLHLIQKIILTIVYGALSFMINLQASILAIFLGFFFIVGFNRIVNLSKQFSIEVLNTNEKTNSYTNEFLESLRYLFSTSSTDFVVKNLVDKLKKYSHAKYKLDYYGKLSKDIPEPIGVMIIVAILIVNHLSAQATIITVLMSSFLLYRTFRNIASIQYVFQKLIGISASIERVVDLNRSLEEIRQMDGKVSINNIEELRLEDVSFDYSSGEVLQKLNLKFIKGKSYAIVGESGSGKSSLLNLLTILNHPVEGKIYINDQDSINVKKSLFRKKIGYISQELVYFDGSIKENIQLNNKTNQSLKKVIDQVLLNDLVKNKGLDKSIINFGKNLSGGQLQKINIAREIYKNPKLLLMDEASSALDSNSEKKIMKNILKNNKDKIIIITAHRLSILKYVDVIILLDNNSKLDSGNMTQLYHSNKKFKKMCNNQSIFLD